MVEYDPAIAARFAELREAFARAAADPDVGEAQVRPLIEEYEQLMRDPGLDEEAERRRRMSRYHPGRGRAVDWRPPRLTPHEWISRP